MDFGLIPDRLQRCVVHYNSQALASALGQENITQQSVRSLQQLHTWGSTSSTSQG